ncbi:MAG: hypothetical protein U1F52_10680 [Burkholderiales bacterium]
MGVVGFLLLTAGLVAGALVWFAIDREALIDRTATVSAEQVGRAKRLLAQHDPRRLKPGDRRAMVLSQQDVDTVLNYVLQQAAHGSSRVVLQPGFADVAITVPLPSNPIGRYANVRAEIMETDGPPHLQTLSIGRITLPGFLQDLVLSRAVEHFGVADQAALLAKLVRHASFGPRSVRVVVEWQDHTTERLRAAVVSDDEAGRLRVYHDAIAEMSSRQETATMSLPTLLAPLMAIADTRSRQGNAAAENRAVLIAVTAYVTGGGIELLVPDARRWNPLTTREVALAGRDDFAKHFIVSAMLAATAGTPLANAAGLYKELDDSRGGSGFSFNDIAADAAGTQFGRLAVADEASAIALQKRVAAGVGEADIMPPVTDLPEFMPEQEFVARFGGVGAPKYQEMMAEIDRRVTALAIASRQ